MVYADVDFYTTVYSPPGRTPTIPPERFEFYERRARSHIDEYTFDRIDEATLARCAYRIGMCVCELAEHLYLNEGSENRHSESISGRAVTYVKGYEYRVCQRHLMMTGLTYRGQGDG